MIVFKHVEYCLPEKSQIILGKAGGFAGKVGGNVPLAAVKGVGDDVFITKCMRPFFIYVFLTRLCNTSDCYFLW